MKFEDLPLDEQLQKAVREVGYESPTPIQEKAIPPLLEGNDLMGIAQTGTGKTAAFALPILQKLIQFGKVREPKCTRVLILLPTRELAIQVADCFDKYSKYTGLSTACVFGGVSDVPQKRALIRGVDVLVATPGRLLDLINQRVISLKKLEFFVLDEADRMLDMGFIHDIRKVVALLPPVRQNLFFSATMPDDITKLAATILRPHPVRVEVAPQSKPIERINQELYRIEKRRKGALLRALLLSRPEMSKVLVFSRTKHGANRISETLEKANIPSAAIHGNKSQTRRQEALGNFKCGLIRVLVATDIAARGIDIDDVTHVINYDLPEVPETYVHRIGRTARAGKDGAAIAFVDSEEESDLRAIERITHIHIPEGDPAILATLPKEAPGADRQQQQGGRGPRRGGFQHGNNGGNRHGNFHGDRNRNDNRGQNGGENRNQNPNGQQRSEQNNDQQRQGNGQGFHAPKTHSGHRIGSRARRRFRDERQGGFGGGDFGG